jgi:hypothetical protein
MTDPSQLLDQKVFTVLQASAKRLFLRRVNDDRGIPHTTMDGVLDLIGRWVRLTATAIEVAWEISMP